MSSLSHHAHRYLIALGSNLGDRLAYLKRARDAIGRELGSLLAHASYYETQPLGAADQPFINSALAISSELPPDELLAGLLRIETELGRVRRERWGNRVIDLDLLLWQRREDGAWVDAQWHTPQLEVPHPQLLERDFVLVPAAEIAGAWRHATGATLAEALRLAGFALAASGSA